ncbi:MAG: type II toxin-antitoxin system RelE/ParE family toxin [Mariprofundaceae bacterium]|nr:type II toxin-antitoxin system RelE/ParE family toxin [Mariprofundaceae bacterium]
MREIKFYKLESGDCPIEVFLDSLSGKQVQKVAWTLQLIEEMDFVPTKYFKKLVNTDDIWEVRVQVGNNIFRLLGFLDGGNLVILNHAFQKKTQKTPSREIHTAETRKQDYLNRRII